LVPVLGTSREGTDGQNWVLVTEKRTVNRALSSYRRRKKLNVQGTRRDTKEGGTTSGTVIWGTLFVWSTETGIPAKTGP